MKKLVKIYDGKIEEVDFSGGIPPFWILSPVNANIQFLLPGLKFINSIVPQSILKPINYDKCVIDISNTFNPHMPSERALISIFENSDISLDIEEYYDDVLGTAETYPYFRIVKDYNDYTFFWSNDRCNWTFLGKAGVVMSNPMLKIENCEWGTDYVLNSVKIYRDFKVRFTNLSEGDIVELYQNSTLVASGTVSLQKTYTDIDISKFENLTFDVKIKSGGVEIFSEANKVLCGGDIYIHSNYIVLLDENDNEIQPLVKKSFGRIPDDFGEYKLKLHNDSTDVINRVDVALEAGSTGVYIAKDISGIPGVYESSISYTSIEIDGIREFWVKMYKSTIFPIPEEVQFALDITTT